MKQSEIKTEKPLQKYLFYRGQVYFQILTVIAILAGTIILRSVFTAYGLPEYLFKIIILVCFSLAILVIGLQATLHHSIVSEGVVPVSWLAQALKTALSRLNDQTSSQPANIPDLEKEVKEILKVIGDYKEPYREVKNLTETLTHLIDLLHRYWQAATRNEVLAAMGRISAEVAHDLRGPLSSLQVALQHLKKGESDAKQVQQYLNLLELSSDRLMGVANNLLAKYKGEQEAKSIFSIHQILDELVGEFSYQEQYSAVKFIKKYHPHDLLIEGDRHAVQRLFGNLIKNGAEAMQFVGPLTLVTNKQENHAQIKIADTGCGIPQSKLGKIFGGLTEGKKQGHGIGLQFVKKTALAHGGRVWVETVFGEGSSFFVELPLATKETLSFFSLDVSDGEPVVVIDDDPSMLEQWRLVLKAEGLSVLPCSSYEDFEAKDFSLGKCQTAVVDYHFDNSELNGLQVIEKLKAQGFKNLYLCTAEYWKPSLKARAEELGVAVCPKPLPRIVVRHASSETLPHPNPPLTKGREHSGYKVLVIDDDQSIRLCWEIVQKKLSIEKLYCYPDLEALLEAQIDLREIDIAFVDKNIEGSRHSGAEALSYLKSKGVVKVVLASGESEAALREEGQFSQADFISSEKIPRSFKDFFPEIFS